jgi:transposase
MSADDSFPDDVVILKAMLRAERAARLAAEAEAQARTLTIEKLKLTIKKLARTVRTILGAWRAARSA